MKNIILFIFLFMSFLNANSSYEGKEKFINASDSSAKSGFFSIKPSIKTSASVGEVEIGNMLQETYLKWSKINFNSNKPSFIEQENIMRASGCSVSYHRCYYKGMYYTFTQLATTPYKKIDTSLIIKPARYVKKKKKTGKTVIVRGPNAVYIKENKPINTTAMYETKIPKTASMSPFGIGDPNCVAKIEGGVLPKLPSGKQEAFDPKALPCISAR